MWDILEVYTLYNPNVGVNINIFECFSQISLFSLYTCCIPLNS